MGLLNMTGGNVPPIPIQPTHVGGHVEWYETEERERLTRHNKILKDDNELFTMIKIWVQQQL